MTIKNKVLIILLLFVIVCGGKFLFKNIDNDTVAYTNSGVNISKITLNKTILSLSVGDTAKLSVTLSPSNASTNDIIWASNDKSVVRVDSSGNVSAVGVGAASIVVVARNNYSIRAICRVTVLNNNTNDNKNDNSDNNVITSKKNNTTVTKVILSKNNVNMKVGGTTKLTASLLPVGVSASVSWNSSDEGVVKVANDGTVSAIGTGKAVVTASSGSVSDKCTVTVTGTSSTSNRAQEFLNALNKISKDVEKQVKSGKKWKYGWKGHSGSFAKAKSSGNRKLTCIVLPSWGLIEMGVLKSGQIVGNQKGKNGMYTWYRGSGTKAIVKKNFNYISGHGKTAKSLIKSGNLKAGDIVMWKHYHTSVYAGDHKWYDAGRVKTNGATQKHPYFKTFGPVSYNENRKIRQILRFKN